MNVSTPQILLVNDDGILSPGLWAAAAALAPLGFVTVAAPHTQFSGAGRSLTKGPKGKIEPATLQIGDQEWTCYSIQGSPAESVQIGINGILKRRPDLVVSGINYGENPSTEISMSGTVGAAIEAAAHGVPALAVSLELENQDWYGYSRTVDFSAAAHFTQLFASLILEHALPTEVDLLNINVPAGATPATAWRMTRLSRNRYFVPYLKEDSSERQANIESAVRFDPDDPTDQESDVHAMRVDKIVSVTPLTIDFTAHVNLQELEASLKNRIR
jgi:5'-nucleotidase